MTRQEITFVLENYCIKLFFFLKTKFTKDYLMIFIIQDKLSNSTHLEELKSENKNINKIKIGSLVWRHVCKTAASSSNKTRHEKPVLNKCVQKFDWTAGTKP